jgi:short-subunit dehydrogenase
MTLSPFSLENKTILVTGASSGIGRASAIMASQMGARIIATGRDSSRLDECLSSLTGEGHVCIPIDLIDELAIKNFAIECSEIDGLVFAAGIAEVVPFKLISMRHIDRLIKLNFYSPSLLTSLLHKHKKLRPLASLVYISSIASKLGVAGTAMYAASKAALNAFMKILIHQSDVKINKLYKLLNPIIDLLLRNFL